MRRLVAVLLLTFLLTGCGYLGSSNVNYNKYVGTDGITIQFEKGSPPDKLYENHVFPVTVELHNAGALNVAYD